MTAELAAFATAMVDSSEYMTLGTADEDGRPWVSPVWFAHADYREFLWVSRPERRHSRNIAARAEVSIVIFDSRSPIGTGRGVYMSALAAPLEGGEAERGIEVFSRRSVAHGAPAWMRDDVSGPAHLRLYGAVVTEQFVSAPNEDRVAVTLGGSPRQLSAPTISELVAERIDGRHRGFGAVASGLEIAQLGAQGYSLRRGDLPLPLLVLRERALASNLRVMQAFCDEHGVSLAPHGKTSMAPQLIRRQLAAGAWGMTAATVQQVGVMRAAGAERVILANELVGEADIAWLQRERDAGLEVFVLVDSPEGVALLTTGLDAAGAELPLPVLIELGGPRAGCRTDEQALAVAEAVGAAPRLVLAGVEGFEGALGADREPATLAAVDAFLDRMRRLVETLDADGAFAEAPEILATAGGSAYFDRVAQRLRFKAPLSRPVRVVVRAGCYLTHDDGLYENVSPLPELEAALELWARVASCPEPGLAIAGFGKRDASYDLGLPVVREVRRGAADPAPADGLQVTALNDQHAFVSDPHGTLRPGDVLVCGISHPCTAFDKWPLIAVVDDADVVIDAVRTLF